MTTSSEDRRPVLFLHTPGKDFVRPYFIRHMADYDISDNPCGADHAVMISCTEIYDVTEGHNYDELTPVIESSPSAAEERRFGELCASNGLSPVILRSADIIGTGMGGFPRMLANKIYRGTFIAIKDNDAVRSFVHASSLPGAASAVLDSPGIYNVTDRTETKLNDMAEALAWRIAQKRIFSLGSKWYKFIFGRRNYDEMSRSLTFSCDKLCRSGNYDPARAVDYLKTHIYDDKSL